MDDSVVDFGRDICGDLNAAEAREWLVTNGIGGFASGTVAGLLTRRYHGLLIAALRPPLGRTLLVSKLEEVAEYCGAAFALSTNRWADGAISPGGYRHIERFRLEGTTPVWTFALGDALFEKRVWMHHGFNITYVRYDLARASALVKLTIKALVNYRDYHSLTHAGDWQMDAQPVQNGQRVVAFRDATPFYLLSASADAEPAHDWYRNFDLAAERRRGLDDHEDHLHAADFTAQIEPGGSLTLVLGTEPAPDLDGNSAYQERQARESAILDQWAVARRPSSKAPPSGHAVAQNASPAKAPAPSDSRSAPRWVRQLVLAADQFIVKRPLPGDADAQSVIAGYPWFGDWGRDTMISLPGLTLVTGRPQVARSVLRTFAKFVDRGMLPNRFPETGETPQYNTVDATLWYFEAVRQYYAATRDQELVEGLFPLLADIVAWHTRGTRYNIHVDRADGLVYAGEPGVQLTWMDAKVGDWVVTPRIGKPVEVNALWYNALVTLTTFARELRKPTRDFQTLADQARQGFQRFWNESTGCCFDVLDGPGGNDASLRPNQLIALSLKENLLTPQQERSVLDACARHLLTSYGLRSLASTDARYQGCYRGDKARRDGAYHQGTAWGWLIGPFVLAHLRVHQDAALAASYLEPLSRHLQGYGLGSIGEIFDGDPPFGPCGCIAQAWSVAEVLRAWAACEEQKASGSAQAEKNGRS